MAIDKIGSKALTDSSVVAADIAPGTVTTTQLAGSITNAKLANSTVTVNGTSIALGASGSIPAVSWQSVVVSDGSTVTTMVAGNGYFVNNTSAAGLVKLPTSASAGDTVAIKDYAGNFGTNNLTIQRNGHNIQGVANDSLISTNRASLTLVYIDATKGWLYTNESNVQNFTKFVAATGGTLTTSGDFKIHVFTGDGNFVVSCAGNAAGSQKLDYLVVAGGGGAGGDGGGGGGAGGFRVSNSYSLPTPTMSPLINPTGITAAVQTYPITVGGGGSAVPPGNAPAPAPSPGSNSVFSTITSAGGGASGGYIGGSGHPDEGSGKGFNGGSGGAGSRHNFPVSPQGAGGVGNTPPVSPPQGNNGGTGNGTTSSSGGGGGAGAVGQNGYGPSQTGDGGAGSFVSICLSLPGNGTPGPVSGTRYFAGGGGGGGNTPGPNQYVNAGGVGGGGQGFNGDVPAPTAGDCTSAGTANTGGGGAGGGNDFGGTAGGKGIVIIRYKFQ